MGNLSINIEMPGMLIKNSRATAQPNQDLQTPSQKVKAAKEPEMIEPRAEKPSGRDDTAGSNINLIA